MSTWVSHRALSIDDRVHEGRAFKSATGANSSELSLRGRVPFSTGIQIRVSAGTTFAVGRNS